MKGDPISGHHTQHKNHRDKNAEIKVWCDTSKRTDADLSPDAEGIATCNTPKTNYNKMQLPPELGGLVTWTRRVLAVLNAGHRVSNDRLQRVKALKTSDFGGCIARENDGDTGEKIHLFDHVAIVYEVGEGAKRTYVPYIGQVRRIYHVPEKGGSATKYLFPVKLDKKHVYLRIKLLKPAKEGNNLCFTQGLDILEDCDAVPLHTVLAKVSLRFEQEGDMQLYYLSEQQSKMVKNLAKEIQVSVSAPEAHAEDEAEVEADARPKAGKKRGRAKPTKADNAAKKADKEAETARVRGTILHEFESTVNRGRGDYTPPLGWVVSEKAMVAKQLVNGGLLADNFLKGRRFIQRFGGRRGETVEWFEGEVVKRYEGSMSDFYDVKYLEEDGRKTECKHKCVALGYGGLAADCWCLIEKAAGQVKSRKTANVQKALRH